MVGWGLNSHHGQLSLPPGLDEVAAIEAGSYHSAALMSNGTVAVWGDSRYGVNEIPPGTAQVTEVKVASGHLLALRQPYAPLPAGLEVSSEGHLAGTATNAAEGLVTFFVEDALGESTNKSFHFAVDPNPDRPPVIVSNRPHTAALHMDEGASASSTVWAEDPESHPLSYRWTWDGEDVGGDTNRYTHTANWGAFGPRDLRCYVSDPVWPEIVSGLWEVTIDDLPIVATTVSLPAGTELVHYVGQLEATNGVAPFTWALSSGALPQGLGLSSDGAITGVATNAGTYPVGFLVEDALGESTNGTAQVVILPHPNRRPVIVTNVPPEGVFSMGEGTGQVFQVSAYDPEGSNLVYRWTSGRSGQAGTRTVPMPITW